MILLLIVTQVKWICLLVSYNSDQLVKDRFQSRSKWNAGEFDLTYKDEICWNLYERSER